MKRMSSRRCIGIALAMAGSIACGAPSASAQQASYLPLDAGAQWELHSKATSHPMVFTVDSSNGSRHANTAGQISRVDWQNPWVKAAFVFRVSGKRVFLDGLDMGNGVAPMPANTTYFQFDAPAGTRWSNAVGNFAVVTTDATVNAPSGAYAHCIEIVVTDVHHAKTFWFFAPDVGFVQFGEGSSAFFLTRYTARGNAAPPVSQPPPPQPPAQVRDMNIAQGGIYIGLESNPTPKQGYSFSAKQESETMSAQAGSRLVFIGPKWDEIEPSPGHYDFQDVDDRVNLAKATGSVVLLNLRLIDTSRKTVPGAYQHWGWDDQRLEAKIVDAFNALSQHLEGRVRWVSVGNEVNEYFSSHRGEVEPYARMLTSLLPSLHRDFPNAPVTVNFTAAAVDDLRGRYRSIVDQTEIDSLNYYPINADFTFRDPSTCGRELQNIISSATGHKIIFQEMGYPSSQRLGSSEDNQARFLLAVFQVLAMNASRVQAVSFNWRSDLPESVVQDLTSYYKLGNSENFREFLSTLGWFRRDGTPKKIWYVFEQKAPGFASAH